MSYKEQQEGSLPLKTSDMVAVAVVVTGAKVTLVGLAMMMEDLAQSLGRALVVGLEEEGLPLPLLLMMRTGEL